MVQKSVIRCGLQTSVFSSFIDSVLILAGIRRSWSKPELYTRWPTVLRACSPLPEIISFRSFTRLSARMKNGGLEITTCKCFKTNSPFHAQDISHNSELLAIVDQESALVAWILSYHRSARCMVYWNRTRLMHTTHYEKWSYEDTSRPTLYAVLLR